MLTTNLKIKTKTRNTMHATDSMEHLRNRIGPTVYQLIICTTEMGILIATWRKVLDRKYTIVKNCLLFVALFNNTSLW